MVREAAAGAAAAEAAVGVEEPVGADEAEAGEQRFGRNSRTWVLTPITLSWGVCGATDSLTHSY